MPNVNYESRGGLGEINKFRASMGLGLIRTGKKKCITCGKVFESKDVKQNRMCPACTQPESHTVVVV